jgi:hypothetical protein
MPALTPNIENRVRKLPKPSNAAQGLQPLFEAVSNSVYAIEDRLSVDIPKGRIIIKVSSLSDPSEIEIVVSDNGIGLDAERYAAFCEIDTDFYLGFFFRCHGDGLTTQSTALDAQARGAKRPWSPTACLGEWTLIGSNFSSM